MRCCKVIAVSYAPRRSRTNETWPSTGHNQVAMPARGVQRIIDTVWHLEQMVNPGVPMDTIIVNNNTGHVPGNKFLESINGEPTKRGLLHVVHRENYGFAYGAFDYAFQKFHTYDHWMFVEDDLLLVEENYYKDALDFLNSGNQVVAMVPNKGKFIHSGFIATRQQTLIQIVKHHGSIPHCSNRAGDIGDNQTLGEKMLSDVINNQLALKVYHMRRPYYLPFYEYQKEIQE